MKHRIERRLHRELSEQLLGYDDESLSTGHLARELVGDYLRLARRRAWRRRRAIQDGIAFLLAPHLRRRIQRLEKNNLELALKASRLELDVIGLTTEMVERPEGASGVQVIAGGEGLPGTPYLEA